MTRQPARCGTISGHTAHIRDGQKPCQPCRDAQNGYMAAYNAAVRKLIAGHRAEFTKLLDAEKQAAAGGAR